MLVTVDNLQGGLLLCCSRWQPFSSWWTSGSNITTLHLVSSSTTFRLLDCFAVTQLLVGTSNRIVICMFNVQTQPPSSEEPILWIVVSPFIHLKVCIFLWKGSVVEFMKRGRGLSGFRRGARNAKICGFFESNWTMFLVACTLGPK
jgi:hypothetical protein